MSALSSVVGVDRHVLELIHGDQVLSVGGQYLFDHDLLHWVALVDVHSFANGSDLFEEAIGEVGLEGEGFDGASPDFVGEGFSLGEVDFHLIKVQWRGLPTLSLFHCPILKWNPCPAISADN